MDGLLLEHKGGTAMKHAIAFCSWAQKTADICGGRCSANKCHFLLPMAAGTFCSFSSLLSHFPSLTSSPFVHCVCPCIQHKIYIDFSTWSSITISAGCRPVVAWTQNTHGYSERNVPKTCFHLLLYRHDSRGKQGHQHNCLLLAA